MRRETWLADQVEVTVSGLFTTHHLLRTATGVLGALTLPVMRLKGVFRGADGRELVVKRTSWWRGTYKLHEDGDLLGTARPLGIFRRENTVTFDDQTYRLSAAGFWARIWHLKNDAGEVVVEVRPRGALRRGATLRIVRPVDLALLVFTYHLVNARWQEQTTAVSAAAASS
jgi:hypothetical protein